jgi:hypothetical protein
MPKRPKRLSRPKRWADAVERARAALEELNEMRDEYEEWRQNLPENLDSSQLAEKLDAVVDLDFQSALDTIEEAESIDLPRGFGKD